MKKIEEDGNDYIPRESWEESTLGSTFDPLNDNKQSLEADSNTIKKNSKKKKS